VPALEDVLKSLPKGTRYMLDVKVCHIPNVEVEGQQALECNSCAQLGKRVQQLLRAHGIPEKEVVFTSTDVHTLRSFASSFPAASFALSFDLRYAQYSARDFMSLLEDDDWDAACMYVGLAGLRPDLVRAVRSSVSKRTGAPRSVYAWTVRRPLHARVALCAGVRNLIVADPIAMARAVVLAKK
jgi:hypothetical protein